MNTSRKPTIAEFMTTEPCTVNADLTIADAQERMGMNNIRHLLVESGGRLVGVLSTRDIAVAASLPGIDAAKLLVRDAMTGRVFTCRPADLLVDISQQMEAHRLGCTAVVDDGLVVGIFTTTDALRALRQVLVGAPVAREVTPDHRVTHEAHRDLATHHMRVSDSLRSHGAAPSATQGMFRP